MNNQKPSLNLELNITENCNMRCKYCFEEGYFNKKNMTINQAEKICNRIIELSKTELWTKNYNGVTITFWGGEPTVNPKVIEYIYNKIRDNIQPANFFVYSNGLKTAGLKHILKNKDIDFQISYDGKPVHDMNRVDVKQQPTADKILKTVEELVTDGIMFGLKATIAPPNFKYLSEIYDDFSDLNDKMMKIHKRKGWTLRYAPTIDYHNIYTDLNFEVFSEQLKKLAYKEIDRYRKTGNFLTSWFDNKNGRMCSAGRSYFTVEMNGDIFNCHGCIYSDNAKEIFREQNIFNDDFMKFIDDRYNNSIYEVPEKCLKCNVSTCSMCNVVCFERSDKETYKEKWNDIAIQDNFLCMYYKEITKYKAVVDNILFK